MNLDQLERGEGSQSVPGSNQGPRPDITEDPDNLNAGTGSHSSQGKVSRG